MDIYIPAKNLYSDCLHIIGVAKLLAKPNDKIYMMKNLFYHNRKRNYFYTHNFEKYFSLKTIPFITNKDKPFLNDFYNDLDLREKIFRQEIRFPDSLILNRHHFNYIYKVFPHIQLEYPISLILLKVLKEVSVNYNIDIPDYSDRIGVYLCFDSTDEEKELDNSTVLSFLNNVKNTKLFIVCDDLKYLPNIDKSNDIILYDKNVKLFISNSTEQDNLQMLDNTLESVYSIVHCKKIVSSNNLFCNLFIPFMKISINHKKQNFKGQV